MNAGFAHWDSRTDFPLVGAASWVDPVNISRYFCDFVPLYVCDVKALMANKDGKTGEPKWKLFEDGIIHQARPDVMDSTRKARLGNAQDPQDEPTGIKDFDVVWVMRWFMRDSQGNDEVFYTLGTVQLLTDAKPIQEVYFHGKRPYVMGFAILETHKVMKTSLPILVRPLQQETNDVANQRLDNVKYVLNKRKYVARGRQVDTAALVRNVPGAVILMNDPDHDVVDSQETDVTSSSYVEHDRLSAELDDLAGNFSPSTKVANNAVNDTLGGSRMASAGAGLMSEYLIRTINETWWEPVLRQLALLEQQYETDEVLLSICAEKAQLFPRFGLSRITDMLLMEEVVVNVDMAMGDPRERFQKFMMATGAAIQIVNTAPPGANVPEMIKEIYSNAGYRDGARFFGGQQDPRLLKAMQMLQQMKSVIDGKQMELQAQGQIEQAKLVSNERIKGAQLQVDTARITGDLRIREAEVVIEQQKLMLDKMQMQIDMMATTQEKEAKRMELAAKMQEASTRIEEARLEIVRTRMEVHHDAMMTMRHEERATQ